ncbi:MAG: AbrB family transcriptional regulator [Candidatus Woesearchaeota archaeon]
MATDLVKMSPKGQLVVPEEIRENEGFMPGDRFVGFQVKEGVLFKRVKIPDVKLEFEKLAKDIEKHFKKQSITREDIGKAVRWARKK